MTIFASAERSGVELTSVRKLLSFTVITYCNPQHQSNTPQTK